MTPTNGQIVAEAASPSFTGKVVTAGERVSEIKWLDAGPRGALQMVPNEFLIPAKESAS